MKISNIITLGFCALTFSGAAMANTFVNGGFEDGTASGWTSGGGYRGDTDNPSMNPALFLPNGIYYDATQAHSSIIKAGTLDANLGSLLGSTVYSGNYSYRAEDLTYGGYASVISQKVTNYTDPNIYFAWKAVLENGGHSADQSALLQIVLHDDTTNKDIVSRIYNAGAGGTGVDSRFNTSGSLFYTPAWQIEQINIDASLKGHDFTLSLLAADCEPTGHTGYAYLDGFGSVNPPVTSGVPLPGTLALLGLGLAGLAVASKRKTA